MIPFIPGLKTIALIGLVLIALTFVATQLPSAHAQEPPEGTAPAPTQLTDDTGNTQPSPAPTMEVPTPTATPVPPQLSSIAGAFRVGPTTSIRPVNDIISFNQDGLIEVMFRNPILNDVAMEVELSVSVPAGFHLYGEGLASDVAAGTASAHYTVHPGHTRTVYLNVKAAKIGQSTLHFSANYWPAGNKDLFNPTSLTHPFTVTEASKDPLKAPNAGDAATGDNGDTSGPAASCALGSVAKGDISLLSIGLLGLTGMMFVRRKRTQ